MTTLASSLSPSAPLTACAIRYRLDGPGPAAFLVDCGGEMRVYARGGLGGVMPRGRLLALLAERGCRWVPASGIVPIDLTETQSTDESEPPLPDVAGFMTTGGESVSAC